jgi:hypothetical protein
VSPVSFNAGRKIANDARDRPDAELSELSEEHCRPHRPGEQRMNDRQSDRQQIQDSNGALKPA